MKNDKPTPAEIADEALQELERICASGKTPAPYDSSDGGFWFDWWPNLPWQPDELEAAMNHLVTNCPERLYAVEAQLVDLVGGMPIREQLAGNLHDAEVLR